LPVSQAETGAFLELAPDALQDRFESRDSGHEIGAGSRTPAREEHARHPAEALSGTQSDARVRREASRPRLAVSRCKQQARSKSAWSARFFGLDALGVFLQED
jgi:hypothetical protein